jgi:hypothetical protein
LGTMKAVALGREPERTRGLRWREPVRRTRRRWRRGEELELGRGREENSEKRERVAAGGFSRASVVRGSEGKKEGGQQQPSAVRHGGQQRRAASNSPRPSGMGGGAVAQQGRAAGHG